LYAIYWPPGHDVLAKKRAKYGCRAKKKKPPLLPKSLPAEKKPPLLPKSLPTEKKPPLLPKSLPAEKKPE
jgi:hypothetical protein